MGERGREKGGGRGGREKGVEGRGFNTSSANHS